MQLQTNKIMVLTSLLALMACSDELEQKHHPTLPERIPLEVTAVLDANRTASLTRAVDKEFAEGDKLVAYLRHVTWTGKKAADDGYNASTDAPKSVSADKAPLLVTFTANGTIAWDGSVEDILPFVSGNVIPISSSDTQQASPLSTETTLYWDDFSNSATTDTDLRTDGHYLQSYYGYCYNGRVPSPTLVAETGVIGWSILADQKTSADNFTHSDLLWSPEQLPVSYHHALAEREGLLIPYTHAMSKVSINVTADEGFDENFGFTGTEVTLNGVRTSCKATAPTATLDYTDSATGNVKMKIGTGTGTRTFSAIIVPSVLSVNDILATIIGMDGNNYKIPVTEAVVGYDGTTKKGWGQQLILDDDVYQMKSGVHYVLNVTVSKSEVTVMATIKDWDVVEATVDGQIWFDSDVTTKGDKVELQAHGFDVYEAPVSATPDYSLLTSYTYSDGEWQTSEKAYWPNGKDAFYFRALSPANSSKTIADGEDTLWGTTSKDSENGYDEGQAIKPRTGDVPLTFYHAMSKITVKLEDGNKDAELPAGVEATDYDNPLNPRIDLTGATISIINLYDGATINLHDGSLSDFAVNSANAPFTIKDMLPATASATENKLLEYLVVPQSLVNNKDGVKRTQTPSFYNTTELTKIFADKTSNDDGGDFVYYLTSDLTYVEAVHYTDSSDDIDDINTYNAGLDGAVSITDIRVPEVMQVDYDYETFCKDNAHKSFTEEQFALLNESLYKDAKLKEAAKAAVYYTWEEFKGLESLTQEQFDALPEQLKKKPESEELYTYDEYCAAKVNSEITESDFNALVEETSLAVLKTPAKEAEYYTYEEFIALDYLTEAQFNALPPELKIQVPHEDAIYYTEEEANAYNALLPGAVGVGSVKVPAYYKLPDGDSPSPHNPGDLKSAGDKIMIYVTLADGTLYSAELSECTVTSSQSSHHVKDEPIKQWYPGVSYIYTITLTKEKITFRALIEQWQEVKGGGTATLDWD